MADPAWLLLPHFEANGAKVPKDSTSCWRVRYTVVALVSSASTIRLSLQPSPPSETYRDISQAIPIAGNFVGAPDSYLGGSRRNAANALKRNTKLTF
jgi:hypothetical protein